MDDISPNKSNDEVLIETVKDSLPDNPNLIPDEGTLTYSTQPLTEYGRKVCEMSPTITSRGFVNDNPNRGSNYGIEFTLTGNDLILMSFQGFKIIEALQKELGADSAKAKAHLEGVIIQVRKIAEEFQARRNWVPIRDN